MGGTGSDFGTRATRPRTEPVPPGERSGVSAGGAEPYTLEDVWVHAAPGGSESKSFRGATFGRKGIERSTTGDSIFAGCRTKVVHMLFFGRIVILIVPVPAPLPDIAVHVVESPRVRPPLANRMG